MLYTCTFSTSLWQDVSMLEVEGHLEAFHSADSSKINWNKSLASQVGSIGAVATSAVNFSCDAQTNFSCACGRSFQFQDDLQVHQVLKLVNNEKSCS